MKENDSVKKYLAEFIGTFVLVLFACGTACVVGCVTKAGYLAVALSFGLVIVAMAYSIGNISGCHINPAVSLAMFLSKKMSVEDFIGYVIAQFLGATAGAGVLAYLVGKESGLGINTIANYGWGKSFVVEVILTFVFVLTILGVTSKESFSSVAGIVIGLALTLVHLLGIHFTGTSVNPARSFGPSVIVGGDQIKGLWVFIVAPLVGGALAAFCYKFLAGKQSK